MVTLKKHWSSIGRYVPIIKSVLGFHSGSGRYWEIDLIRGIAVLIMVMFHLSWDLQYFNILSSDTFITFVRSPIYTSRLHFIFILLVGVSLTVSYRRALTKTPVSQGELFKKYLIRGLVVFAFGMAITVVAIIFLGGGIEFGILHLIGFSIIASFPFLRFRWLNLVLGLIIIALGEFYIDTITVNFSWLLWLGIRPAGYVPQDYFPIFPSFGWSLVGLFLGNLLYSPPEKRNFKIPDISQWIVIKQLTVVGRNALFVYLIHQPILFPTVYLISLFT